MIQLRRRVWQYSMFQIPLMGAIACLMVAVLSLLLHWGKPPVSVVIALDLSNSTTGNVKQQEIEAIEAYLWENQSLRQPNAVQILGFASQVEFLTSVFSTDRSAIASELTQWLDTKDTNQVLGGNKTNLDLAISEGVNALSKQERGCRELLVVTDGLAEVSDTTVATAITQKVKINAVILGGQEASQIIQATLLTGGLSLTDEVSNLQYLFTNTLFGRFNSNIKWVVFWLTIAFINLMWMLILPLDRWVFQQMMGFNMTLGGQLALGNALFWTVVALSWLVKIWGLPFGNNC